MVLLGSVVMVLSSSGRLWSGGGGEGGGGAVPCIMVLALRCTWFLVLGGVTGRQVFVEFRFWNCVTALSKLHRQSSSNAVAQGCSCSGTSSSATPPVNTTMASTARLLLNSQSPKQQTRFHRSNRKLDDYKVLRRTKVPRRGSTLID